MALPPTTVDRPGVVSANDALVDMYMERAIDLLRFESGARDRILILLDNLESDLVAALYKVNPTGVAREFARQQRFEQLLKFVRSTIKAAYRITDVKLAQELRDLADVESTWTGRAINAAVKLDVADVGFTPTFITALVSDVMIQGAPTSEWWSRQASGLSDRFADEVRRGMALGETNDQIVSRVRGPAGLFNASRTSAERLVRSSVQTTANAARDATYEKNSDVIASLKWSATLDTRTSIWCITRDGHHYGNDEDHKPLDKGPPWLEGPGRLHWGCRSTSVPVLKSWRDLGIDEDEVPDTTRASMDGQVPHDTTFEQWLKKQSVARQDTVLGAAKADLWRQGRITFRDLLDQSGRPLTLDELRRKAA